jgi:hypothetical protein
MDQLTIITALAKAKPGLNKYLKIMDMVKKVDVSQDEEFQKLFNGFYRMRQRPKIFYKKYYSFMENNKETPPSFEKTLRYIYEELGRMEPSFSSKLVATLNPNMPIWDSVVLNNLKLKAPAYYRKNRLEEIIAFYGDIVNHYIELLDSEKGKIIVELFDQEYPKTGITDAKKVDFVLWQNRD